MLTDVCGNIVAANRKKPSVISELMLCLAVVEVYTAFHIIKKRTAFSSVQFSKAVCIAQLSRMSHCAPAARKPVRFKFMPETHVGDVLVA